MYIGGVYGSTTRLCGDQRNAWLEENLFSSVSKVKQINDSAICDMLVTLGSRHRLRNGRCQVEPGSVRELFSTRSSPLPGCTGCVVMSYERTLIQFRVFWYVAES